MPGSGSYSTWEFTAKNDHCYCFLSYFGAQAAEQTMKGFWDFAAEYGLKDNPYRAGFLQLVAVSDTDEHAEPEYAEHINYFYKKCLHIPPHYFGPPGHQDYRSLEKGIRSGFAERMGEELGKLQDYTYKDFVGNRFVIAGSPATVREQLREAARKLRVGNLMVLLQIVRCHTSSRSRTSICSRPKCCRTSATCGMTRDGKTSGGRRVFAGHGSSSPPPPASTGEIDARLFGLGEVGVL